MSEERVAAASDVPLNEVRVVECGGRSLALSNIDGEYYAIDNVCTHDGGPLGEGRIRNGRILCPRHGAAFDAKTGQVKSLPAVKSVQAYPVTRQGDDLTIECPSSETGAAQ
jgi:3-phenylpropionate/trans-cinnamate dioxygenase ferredoxin subunit